MDLTEHTQLTLAGIDFCAATGVIGGVIPAGNKRYVRDAQLAQHGLDRALEAKEIDAVAVSAHGEELRLVGKTVLARQVDLAKLIKARALVAEAVVAADDLKHARQDRRAHDGGILAERVEDPEAAAQRRILRHADLVVIGGADEGIGDDLVVTERADGAADAALKFLRLGEAAACGLAAHERVGDPVVAVEAGDLLGNVGVVLHVAAPGGNDDAVAVKRKAEGEQDLAHEALVQLGAEQAVDLLRLQLDDRRLFVFGDDVHHAVDHLAAAKLFHELAGALDRAERVHHVKTLFIAGGGVGAHTETHCRAADADAVEVGGFKEHHRRVADDLAVRAAHDAGDAHGLALVADAEHGGRETAVVAVESLNDLALARGADDDPAALHAAEVERVHRLTVFEHDVVGDIDDVVDRAHAAVAQPFAHPGGGRCDPDVFDHACGIAWAKVAVLDLNVHKIGNAAAAALDLWGVEVQRALEGGACLAGETDDAQTVGAVGRDLKFDDGIVVADDPGEIVAGLDAVFVENEDAVGNAVGELCLLGVQIVQCADRLSLGVVGDQIALVEILTAGLDGVGVLTVIDLHVIGKAVALNAGDAPADHGTEHLVAGLDVGGNGGLILVERLVVVQKSRSGDRGVGVVVLGVETELGKPAHHAVGQHAAQLALFDFDAAGQHGLVQRRGNEVADVDVPRTGDDLNGLRLSDVELADPHMVGVGVALHGQDSADDDVFQFRVPALDGFDLGAGERHGVVEFLVGNVVKINVIVEPFSA